MIIHFFCKIFQRNSKLVILGNLSMPSHTHLKRYFQFDEIFNVYLQAKNQLHSTRFSCDIGKILRTCYFCYFGHAWLWTPKEIISTCRKLVFIIKQKKGTSLTLGSFINTGERYLLTLGSFINAGERYQVVELLWCKE